MIDIVQLGWIDISTSIKNIAWSSILLKSGKILLQIVAIYIGFIIVRGLGHKLTERAFSRVNQRKGISVSRAKTLESLTKNIIGYVLIFFLVVTVLQLFGIQATAILAGAGVVGLAIGFGAQGLVSDVVTGFFILLERQMDVGDYVTIGNFEGIVEEVGLRTALVRGFNGTLHYIPNRTITTLSNHSRGNMRALVDITVPASDNLDVAISEIQEICNEISKDNHSIMEGPRVLGVQTYGTSEVVLRVIAKVKNGEQSIVEAQLKKALHEKIHRYLKISSEGK
ncbi:mechanosensitive ion channel family protein [Peribacillus alkalitolerans]|uniref:mechanosensitive ion channel family protein n=1 Tax=Peribacillus alkalitolerans TaxID=1550385 RepID=UPI0023DDF9F2|nr:mechanosensitive ion channel family protein [Peribacillus alkalitolerans]